MTNLNFPAGLPAPLISGFSLQRQDNLARTEFDSGLQRFRRRTTKAPLNASLSYLLDLVQAESILAFHEIDACGGVEYFNISLDFKEGQKSFVARFLSSPILSVDEGRFRVSFEAELVDRAPLLLESVFGEP